MTLEEQKTGWKSLIAALELNPANTQIANQFLLEHTADESILNEAELQNFYSFTKDQKEASYRWITLLRQDQNHDDLIRYIKFCWAVGKSTGIYLLESERERKATIRERNARIEAVGIAAVAAMEAEKFANIDYPSIKDTQWLHQLAKDQPETLEQAQQMEGTPQNHRKVLLAGILFCSAPYDKERSERQWELLLKKCMASFASLVPTFTAEERSSCVRYLKNGDFNAPVPMLAGGKMDIYNTRGALTHQCADHSLMTLLGTACFLAQAQEACAHCAVCLYAKIDPIALAEGILAAAPQEYLMEQLPALCGDLPGNETTLLVAMGKTHLESRQELFHKITLRYHSELYFAICLAEDYHCQRIAEFLLEISDSNDFYGKEQLTTMFLANVTSGAQELEHLLKDEGSLKTIPSKRMKNIQYNYHSMNEITKAFKRYLAKHGWDNFLCRCLAAVTICNDYGYYASYMFLGWQPTGGRQNTIDFIQCALEQEMQLETVFLILGSCYEYIYDETAQAEFCAAIGDALNNVKYFPQLCRSCQDSVVLGRKVSLEVLEKLLQNGLSKGQIQQAKDAILGCAGDSSVQLQNQLLKIYVQHPDWVPQYQEMLQKNKKYAARLMMVRVLSSFEEAYHAVLRQALAQEKNVKVGDAIREVLGQSAAPEEEIMDIEAFADRMLNATSLKKLQWLLKHPLPAVRKKDADNAIVREERLQAILIAYCELGRVGISETAAKLAADLEPADLQVLACSVFDWWMEENAPSKQKWVLAFSAVFGGTAMTVKLRHAINEWPQAARGAIACEAVNALVLSPDPAALMIVDGISRKFKFRQIKNAAAQALTNAAHELGIEPEELADRIVPDLGFSANGNRVFDYGPRQFCVSLTPTLELEIKNDSGKVVKAMPAPGKTDDAAKAAMAYGEFKEMKKQIRATVSAQKERLEMALSSLRCWDKTSWEALFVKNPIMHQFAISLIWGIYEKNKLTDTFRYMEDGSFNTVDEEEYELPKYGKIGLVHPIELEEESLKAWKQQLADYEITQSIQQLDRPIYRLEEDPQQKRMKRFGGKMLTTLALYGKLQKFGWYRGSIQDGGGYYEFYREDASVGIGVELHFSGACVGYNEDEDITVYDAVFYRAGTVERGSYVYDTPKQDNVFALGEIPPRYYSEIVFQLEKATLASTEINPNWEKEYRPNE